MLSGLVLCFALMSSVAFYSVNNIQNKLDKTYFEFAQVMTKTYAGEYREILEKEYLLNDLKNALKSYSSQILQENADISFIEFKDKDNKTIYSSRINSLPDSGITLLSINAPVLNKEDNSIIGSVTVGMTGEGITLLAKAAKKSLYGIFIITWIAFSVIFLLNMGLMSRELKKLYQGVKQISTGKFGYKLESENMGELTDAFNDMSNILSQYEEQNVEQLTLERNKLEAVLMSIINGVIVCDNNDKVVLANSAALSMLDVEEKNLLNKKIQNYIDIHGQKCFYEKIEEFKDTPLNIIEQKPIEFNIEVGKKTIKTTISPMFSKQRDYVGYIIVLLDITRETEVNKLKNTFISNVSHELRTPVTVLRTYIDTLCNNADDFDEETKKEFMQTIDTEAKRLHSMVNDILDFSRLESGNVVLKKEYTDLVYLLKQNINQIKILADEKDIKINFSAPTDLPHVPVNVESMDRVIRNLLSNAIKYSGDGKNITVSAGLNDDKTQFVFSVKDSGIGMAKEHLDKIFDRFYRVENATHTVKGTGLGLHLVKMTVEQHHHGKITVASKEGEGSVFTVYLPLNIDESELA